MRVVFLHGLESGPHGSKFHALRKAFPSVTAPDCKGVLDIETRVSMILKHLDEEPALLVGSSFGGLAAGLVYQQRPDLVQGMVLCAPALHRPAAQQIQSLPSGTIIIHGTRDDVVPVQHSRDAALRFSATLIEVDDDHRLSKSGRLMVQSVGKLMQA